MHNCLKNEFPRRGKLNIDIMGYAGFWLETFRLCYRYIFLFSYRCNEKNTEFSVSGKWC